MAGGPRRCLLFSPGLAGHREVYLRVMAGLLAERGVKVTVATDLSEAGGLATPLFDDLADVLGDRLVDLSREADGGAAMTLPRLRRVVADAGADVTIFAEADDHVAALAAMAAPAARRIPGRLVGVFLRSTNFIYGDERGGSRAAGLSRLMLRHGSLADPRLFHEFLQPRRRLLASALCLDEHFVAGCAGGHAWLPDISAAFDDAAAAGGKGQREAIEWRRRLATFVSRAAGRPLLVYLGAAQHRRGYDRILRLALRGDALVAHCGRPPSAEDGDVAAMREALRADGRLLETGAPYVSGDTAAAFVRAARCVVLPYRNHLGSSGVMLQALAAGRPVLVSDEGLMGWRTRTFHLGVAVAADDQDILADAFRHLNDRGPEPYAASLASYMAAFSRQQVEAALDAALGFGGTGAWLPVPPSGRHGGGLAAGSAS